MKLRAQITFPVLYVAFAAYGWVDFVNTNPDGLANVGLFLITLPVTIVASILEWLTGKQGLLMPEGRGYIGDHALYYFPAVFVTAMMSFLLGRWLDRALAR